MGDLSSLTTDGTQVPCFGRQIFLKHNNKLLVFLFFLIYFWLNWVFVAAHRHSLDAIC